MPIQWMGQASSEGLPPSQTQSWGESPVWPPEVALSEHQVPLGGAPLGPHPLQRTLRIKVRGSQQAQPRIIWGAGL